MKLLLLHRLLWNSGLPMQIEKCKKYHAKSVNFRQLILICILKVSSFQQREQERQLSFMILFYFVLFLCFMSFIKFRDSILQRYDIILKNANRRIFAVAKPLQIILSFVPNCLSQRNAQQKVGAHRSKLAKGHLYWIRF
ncbi:MAG: hypothetical protein IKQ94_00860 [Bacteroidales bacterium]|nr:hypothetical protein [Bacteroidales bacterium]